MSVTDNSGTISYEYDIMNGLTAVTLDDGKKICYTYDDSCRLTSVETPFGTTSYEYDLLDRLVRVVAHDGTATLYQYDANGNRTEVHYANGTIIKYVFDEVNRLVCERILDEKGEVKAQYTYTLGAAGERLKVEETDGDSSRTVEYEYDDIYRLVSEKITTEDKVSVTTYTYDKNSNRLTKNSDGEITEYVYNALNQLISETGIEYSYDLNGNLISKTELGKSTAYSYNARNRLVRVTAQNGADVNVEEYLYDYAGNRTAKIQEFKTTYYLVDTNGALSQVLAEYDENGTLITSYTRADQLISQERDGVKSYYLYDGFDSVRMLADDDGAITDTYTYDAFGNLISSTGNTVNDFLYRGELYDSFTGETELKDVTTVYVHRVEEILHLCTTEGDIDTTTNHPFYVIDKGWVAAGDLKAGDEVYNLDGSTAVVTNSELEKLDEPILVFNLEVEDFHTYFVGYEPVLAHNSCKTVNNGSGIPVKEQTTATNGLQYKSNPKHTPGQPGNRANAGIEPKNSLDLFNNSIASTQKNNQRFAFDSDTNTLHRFFCGQDGVWHWSGSTNQGNYSLTRQQVPSDIIRYFDLPRKGW